MYYEDGSTYILMSLALRGLLALIPALIAKNKGRNFWLWMLYGFFLFLIALIHSLHLKKQEVIQQDGPVEEKPFVPLEKTVIEKDRERNTVDLSGMDTVITMPRQYKREILLTEIDNPEHRYPCEVNGRVTIGRSRSSDICIPHDTGIGRHHCNLYFAQDVLFAHDLGSINHTVVNGFTLTKEDQDMPVHDGDVLLLGNTKLKLTIES